MNVLVGLSNSQSSSTSSRSLLNSPVQVMTSSSIGQNGFKEAENSEQNDQDVRVNEMREGRSLSNLDPLDRNRQSSLYDQLGSMRAQINASSCPSHVQTHHQNGKYAAKLVHSDKPSLSKHGRTHSDNVSLYINKVTDGNRSSHIVNVTNGLWTDSEAARPQDEDTKSVRPCRMHHVPTSSRSIPPVQKIDDSTFHAHPQSAPVNVPNWSKALHKERSIDRKIDSIQESSEEEAEEERLPPHVILAKEYENSGRMTSSVCEGQGRTLKGRDMRRVRNAVWQQIGFVD
ncbi:hypothetical protein KP509_32G048700 [Ceratopteris richardii]|nr:hypothetical protein KP509_32G048700 [Ceratopteris richardii]